MERERITEYYFILVLVILSASQVVVLLVLSCKHQDSRENATDSGVSKKLMTYLLDFEHPQGASKAKWFKEALGFTKENAGGLAKQIIFDIDKATPMELTQYGQKYEQLIPIHGANGRTIITQFNWIKNNDGIVRLVGAIPARK